ncbi:PKD domain-containing protein [Halorussus salinus]|uniref:PKD domain-containing protein n=1 Tax=Halorussus salinus TaxID=1364935 RepID=UPI0010929C70|nr:PKD domain-containing protein [Halorussus salinus]
MKTDNTQRFTQFTAVSLALLVLFSAFTPVGTVGAQSAVSISQTATTATTVAPGDTVILETTVSAPDANGPAIDVDLPNGWTITNPSSDGGTYKSAVNQWVWLSGSHTVTYTVQVPEDAAEGDYIVSAEGSGIDPATDERLTDTIQTTITVDENQAPTADAGSDQTVDEGATVTLDGAASSDPDGDDLSYSWTQTGGPDVTLGGSNTATPSFDAPAEPPQTQTYTFELTVSDGQASSTDTVDVTVEPVNDPPTADAGDDQTVTEGNSVQLSGAGNDVDDSSLSYSWTQTGGPVVSLSDASATQPSFTAPSIDSTSTLTFELTVSDGQASSTDTVTVTVQPTAPVNDPPTADAGDDQTVQEDDPVSLDATGSNDPNGDDLSYSWTQTGGQSVTLNDADTATPTLTAPNVDADETLTFEVAVSDGQTTDTDTVTVTVTAVNQPPTADFDAEPSSPIPGEPVTFDASASSDDGAITSYEWTIETTGGQSQQTLLASDFESGSLVTDGWTHDAMGTEASAGVDASTSNSGSQSAYHHGGQGAIVSPALDAGDAGSLTVSYWIQKGDEAFSENPDANSGEDLIVEYLDANGNWVEVDRIEDSVEPGAETTESVTIDADDALHDGFQLRFHQEGASVASGDYWHVDDVSVVATTDAGSGIVQTSGQTVSHTFDQPGNYEVTLTVTGDDGATDTVIKTVEVSNQQQSLTIPEAVAGQDGQLSTSDIQQAISWWTNDEAVPGTDGGTIDTQTMQELIDMWVENEPVGNGGGA